METNAIKITDMSWSERLFLVLPFLGLGVLLIMISPLNASVPWPPCPLYATTGTLCPGCGSTRVMLALSQGDLALAWRQNPLVIFGLIYLSAAWALLVLQLNSEKFSFLHKSVWAQKWSSWSQQGHPKLIMLTFGLVVLFGILRNFIPALMPLPV